jgi:hypothetical protein
MSTFVAEPREDHGVLLGAVISWCGCDMIDECEGGDMVEYSIVVTLGTDKAADGGRGVAAGHRGLRRPLIVKIWRWCGCGTRPCGLGSQVCSEFCLSGRPRVVPSVL